MIKSDSRNRNAAKLKQVCVKIMFQAIWTLGLPLIWKNLKNLISTIRGGRTYTIKGKEERRGASRERIKVLVEEVWSSFSLGVVVSDE